MACEKQLGILMESCSKEHALLGQFTWRFLKEINDKKYLEELKDRLKSEYKDEPYARHAMMNLLGYVYCCLNKISKGIELFKQVLLEDQTHLNAVCNLVHAYESVGMQNEKVKYEQRYGDILTHSDVDIFKARSKIEEARAACFTDQHHKQANIEFTKKLFVEGLNLGKDNSNRAELMEWKFGLGYHLLRIDKICCYEKTLENKYYKEGMNIFYEVALFSHEFGSLDKSVQTPFKSQRSMEFMKGVDIVDAHSQITNEEDTAMKDVDVNVLDMTQERKNDMCGQAWAYMGVLMNWHRNEFANLKAILLDCMEEHRDFDGYQCLVKATEIAPNCGAVLRRACQEFYVIKQFPKALEYGQRAIDAQPIGFAFYPMGQIYLSMYQDEHDLNNKDKTLLDFAVYYFDKAINKFFKPSYALRDLAVALHLKGDTLAALEKFKMAAEAIGGQGDHSLYEQWAQCLDELGERSAAADKRKLAQNIKNGILPSKYDFVAFYSSKDKTVSEIVESMEKHFGVTGYMFERDCLPGTKIADETKELMQDNSLFFLFVSQNSAGSEAFKNEVSFITKPKERNSPKIIPILLDMDVEDIPYELTCLSKIHAIKYDSKEFWGKLESVFRPLSS